MGLITGEVGPVNEFEAANSLLAYACKGHRVATEFVAEALELWDVRLDPSRVRHAYYRNVPAGPDWPGIVLFVEVNGPGRGVYPVTLVDM